MARNRGKPGLMSFLGNIRREGRHMGLWDDIVCVAMVGALLVAMPSDGFGKLGRPGGAAQKAWAAYTEAQRQCQQELGDFLSSRRPDLKEIILASRDLQLALIERRSLEFNSLLVNHPERVVRDQGISRFSNFDWTDEDAKVLRRSNPDYEAAVRRVEVLRQRSEGHPLGAALRAAHQALAKDAGYQKIYERFEQKSEAAGKLLGGGR